jgi:hypothetical protein
MAVTTADGTVFDIKTWDFSDNGVFIAADTLTLENITVNSVVHIQFQGTNFTPPVMSAKVLRVTDSGIALQLKDTLKPGDAPER